MITITKGPLSQEAGPCWSRANYKGGEIVTSSSGKGFLLEKWGQNREKGPRSGLRWHQDRGRPAISARAWASLRGLSPHVRQAGVRNAE